MRIHLEYNPDRITQYNIVPGLMGVVLSMTMVMNTALAVTRERERGTMESLLATPALPLEVMTGKIVPYILAGYVQVSVILLAPWILFRVPMVGSLPLLYASALSFIIATLAVSMTISTLSRNQMQAMQMSFFYFLPSLLLSGFMFPFRGMPEWAQAIGQALPLTHFLRVLRGILLKGNGLADIWPDIWLILVFGLGGDGCRCFALPTDAGLADSSSRAPGSIRVRSLESANARRRGPGTSAVGRRCYRRARYWAICSPSFGPMPLTEAICFAELFRIRSTEPKVSRRAFLRDSETPGISSRRLSLIRFLRSRLWKLLAKRCASSRMRCRSLRAPLSSGRRKGSGRPGR
jgi:hypothetical protein